MKIWFFPCQKTFLFTKVAPLPLVVVFSDACHTINHTQVLHNQSLVNRNLLLKCFSCRIWQSSFFHIEMSCCFHAQIPFSFSDDWHLCLFQFPKTFRSPSNFQTKRFSTLFSVLVVALISSVNPLLILYLAIIEALVIFVLILIAQKLGCFGIVISSATKNVTFQLGRNSAACRVERGSLE